MIRRLTNHMVESSTSDDRRRALQGWVDTEPPPGLLAYRGNDPVAWCQVAPRSHFVRLFHTRGLALDAPDDLSVWAVTCIYIVPAARKTGLGAVLLRAAVEYARQHGARIVEGYPVVGPVRPSRRSTGSVAMCQQAGFSPVDGGSSTRCVMRREVRPTP
jgi:GNAT superfamily N-acetyltransferase